LFLLVKLTSGSPALKSRAACRAGQDERQEGRL